MAITGMTEDGGARSVVVGEKQACTTGWDMKARGR
jgi:hypothetical protein